MGYTRLNHIDDSEDDAWQSRELVELATYPRTERILTGSAKVVLAILSGGSTVVTFIFFTALLTEIAAGAFAIGALIYAIKAFRDAHKKRVEERALTKELNEHIDAIRQLFTADFFLRLNHLIQLCKANQLAEDETEQLYAHLFELKKVLAIVNPVMASTYVKAVEDGIVIVKEKVCAFRPESPDEDYQPHMNEGVICFESEVPQKKPFSLLRIAKQLGNRTLSFVAGASSGVGIALTVAALGFGVSNPAGWVLAAIVGVGLLVGVVSVAVDYYLSRREEDKIQRLHQKNRELVTVKRGMEILQSTLKRICTHTEGHGNAELRRLRQENVELQCKLKAKETVVQTLESPLRSNSVFHSGGAEQLQEGAASSASCSLIAHN